MEKSEKARLKREAELNKEQPPVPRRSGLKQGKTAKRLTWADSEPARFLGPQETLTAAVPGSLELMFHVFPSGEPILPYKERLAQARQWTTGPFAFLQCSWPVPMRTVTLEIQGPPLTPGPVEAQADPTLAEVLPLRVRHHGGIAHVTCSRRGLGTEYFRQTWVPGEVDGETPQHLTLRLPAAAQMMTDVAYTKHHEVLTRAWASGSCRDSEEEYMRRVSSLLLSNHWFVRMADIVRRVKMESMLQVARLGKKKKEEKDLATHKDHWDIWLLSAPVPDDTLEEVSRDHLRALEEEAIDEVVAFCPAEKAQIQSLFKDLAALPANRRKDFKYCKAGAVLMHLELRGITTETGASYRMIQALMLDLDPDATDELTVAQEMLLRFAVCPSGCDPQVGAEPVREVLKQRYDDVVPNPEYRCKGCGKTLLSIVPALRPDLFDVTKLTLNFQGMVSLVDNA
jgi:hypothetical protein